MSKFSIPYSVDAMNDIIDVDFDGDYYEAVFSIKPSEIENKELSEVWQELAVAFKNCDKLIEKAEKIINSK